MDKLDKLRFMKKDFEKYYDANFNCDIARTMFDYMLDIIPENIEKNELKSYMLIEE